jgi:signal transduction histidine kinase
MSGRSATLRIFLLHLAASFLSAAVILAVVYFGAMRLLEGQTAAVVEAELSGLVDEYNSGGQFALRNAIARRTASRDDASAVYLFATGLGAPIAGNLSEWPAVALDGRWRRVELIRTDIARRVLVGGRAFALPGGSKLFVGRDLQEQREFQRILSLSSGALLVLFLLSGTLVGFAVSRTVLRRVDDISKAASEISAGDLSRRAPVTGANDEFDRLAGSLNEMLSKNEALISELRIVTDSLAHDLRTPLSRLRARLEAAAESPERRMAQIDEAISDADYIQSVFGALIDIARAEAGIAREQFERIDLSEIVRDAADLYAPLIEEKDGRIEVDADQPTITIGHRQFIARAVANLLDNAVKYSPQGGVITASTRIERGRAIIEIRDQGPGVSAADWPVAIRRFGRLQEERNSPGAGLGLSLVATVARMHSAELRRCDAASGLCVSMEFPAAGSSERV